MENKFEYQILKTFLYKEKQKFSEIEKALKIRSNKLTYYIKRLLKKGILIKEKEEYQLSETAENLIPYISKKKNCLSIILINLGNSKKSFLYKRTKKPFKDKLSLPGGRILLGESFENATKRILKEKHNINAKLKATHSVSIEHIKKFNKIIQTDLVVFITASTKDKIKLIDIEKNKSQIIPSDYKLLKQDLNKEIKIKKIISKN